jgi:ABC-type polysaccharide/polyol phosphate transport system ATPase subunit
VPAEEDPGSSSEAHTIRLDDVAVCYRLPKERIPSLKEYAIRRLRRAIVYEDFWALHGVSLAVRRGEVFGIIGRNGSGKSTLLRVVARVLKPTRGRVRVSGRIAPLLELGAGFDAELTGRENVYLNGAILGYTRQQIRTYFDRIVDFAGVHDFIDAPLRTYSSGMVVRLGFAVATEVQPDVLIVDEVLAVGDAEFQQKSSERIKQFHANGATMLLVSHNLQTVRNLCSRVAWLEQGVLRAVGSADAVVQQYEASIDRSGRVA